MNNILKHTILDKIAAFLPSLSLLGRVGVGLLLLTSCSDTISSIFGGGEIEQGEAVVFNTLVPDIKSASRSAKSEWKNRVDAYKAVNQEYTFNIEMWKNGAANATDTTTYKPISTNENGEIKYNEDGTLQAAQDVTPLYWQDNVSQWGFKATTVSSEIVEADQSDQQKWLRQDKLVGYSYLPIWTGGEDDGHETDNVNQINYRTSKQWYADNKTAKALSGLMGSSNDDYKKIPLYLQHQRSWVTIILKAGEGVTREALAYETSGSTIETTIYSYTDGEKEPFEVTGAWSREHLINYDSDKNGDAANGVSTTRYDAIVEPHNFIATTNSQEKDIIARINVSNQSFTFSAANDRNYASFIANGGTEEAKKAMQAYDLKPGKHLTITATLSRASRMIMITAWIEDWTETVTQTVCDDYGQNGNPILIENRAQLEAFLNDTDKNKAGNVGLLVPNSLSLSEGDAWPQTYDLKATLNLAGATLNVNRRLFNKIERTGSIVNGVVLVDDAFNGDAAVASVNQGTIERIRVTTSGEQTPAKASRAGIAVANYGTIYQCTSALPVYGTTAGYVGGIAAMNLYSSEAGSTGVIPVVESCTVSARVDGNASVTAGGGIVGQAEGRVSQNRFEYGITLLQDHKFQNIIGVIGSDTRGLTLHSNNSWPTTASYVVPSSAGNVTITNAWTGQHYNAVIDNQTELKKLLTSEYNNNASVYRLAKSFTLNKDLNDENWIWGTDILDPETYFTTDASGTYASGNVKFKLDGNDKTITLTGTTYATMLFGNILGEVYDLNLILAKPIVAARIMDKTNKDVDSNTDGMSAFAYAVTGTGKISNIMLKAANPTTDYIQASIPAGIAVWASNGGTITNCASNVHIRMNIVFKSGATSKDARRYAGGIVATAEKAKITQCKYYGGSGAIGWVYGNTHCQGDNCRYGGIVGGTSEIANSGRNPSLVLTDCSSWWELPSFSEGVTERPRMGSLIGSTVYHDPKDPTKLFNAMEDGNAGNWWTGTVGAGFMMTGITEETAIGKKNSVVPTKPQGW